MAQTSDAEVGHITLNQQEPWPGLRTFSENNADFFFGRDEEVDAIYRMVRQETLTILFGKSGLGKSSILQAGVSPKLRNDGFIPIYIRLNHHEETLPLEDQVEVFIEETIAKNNIDAPAPIREETLWEYFHKKRSDWWDQDNHLLKPVLIFDQFEEILTAGHENAARAARCISFLIELEDLIENRPPENLLKRFKEEKGLAKNYELEQMDYRVLLSLREDYLADFESLRERMRPIMSNRYRLLPMNSTQALSVILKPGGDLVDESVAEKIIDFVSSAKDHSAISSIGSYTDKNQVEPALLSVILRELNNHRIRTGENKISSKLVAGKRPEEILYEFYEEGLKGLSSDVRQFIEQQLLTASGARNRVAEEDAVSRFGLSREEISTLIDRRIIQRDKISHMTWLELSHDTLTPVVKRSAEVYLIKKRRWRLAMRFSSALFAIAVIGIATYLYQAYERELQTVEAANLALDISADLKKNTNIPMSSVQDIVDRLNNRFSTLRDLAIDSDLLKVRHALFYANAADIQLDQGYYERMRKSALLADELIFNEQYPMGIDDASPLKKANVKLSVAETLFYSGNFSDAHKELDLANQFISRVQSSGDNIDHERALSELRSNRIRIQLWNKEAKIGKAVELLNLTLKKSRELAARYIDKKSNSDNSNARRVYEEMFQLYASTYLFIRSYGSLNAEEIYTKMIEDSKQAEQFFQSSNAEYWQYVQALSFQIKALMHQKRNEITDARNSYDIAINYLLNLIKNDNEQLFFRYSLGQALLRRAYFSIGRDSLQSKVDIETAHSLAVTLKRDSSHPYLSCQLSINADYHSNIHASLYGKTGKNQAFYRLMKRIDHCRSELSYQDALDDYELIGYYYQIEFLSKDVDNPASRMEAMRLQKLAFSLLDKLETKGADKLYLSNRRYYMHKVISNSKLAKFLDNSVKESGFIDAIDQLNLILTINPNASEKFSSDKLWLMGEYAIYLLKSNRDQEAIKIYQELVTFGIKQSKLYPQQRRIATNTIWGVTQLIKSYNKQSQWQSALESFDLLMQLYNHQKELDNIPFPEYVLRYWKDSHKALETLNNHFKKSVANKKDTPVASKTKIVLQEQHLTQSRLDKMLALSSQTIKQLQGVIDKKSKESLLTASENIYDAKILKIKHLKNKKNNVYVLEKPLGWSASLLYAAPWSYTLTGTEIEAYKRLLSDKEQQLERVRITALPFYEKGRLITIEFSDKNNQYRTKYYLESEPDGKPFLLNGTSPPIHEANKKFPLRFRNSADVAAYIRFFTIFVQGDESTFMTVESIAEIPWSDNVPQQEKQKVANLLRPLVVWQDDKKTDVWYATATVKYSNGLYHAKFKIKSTGMMEMLGDYNVALNLSVNSLKMTGKSGRSRNFIERLSLDIIKNISAGDLESEFNYLNSLLKDSAHLSTSHRESLANETLSLLEAQIETANIESITKLQNKAITLQKYLVKESLASNRRKSTLNHIYSMLAKKQMENVKRLEKDNKIKKDKLRGEYVTLAFLQLFAKDFQKALNSAQKGIEIDSNYLPTYTNYAHALMFLDRTDEALVIYRKYKDRPLYEKKWKDFVLDDFEQLESAGITHASIKKIREELSKEASQ